VVGKVTKTKSPPPLIIHTEDSIKPATYGSSEEDEESDSPTLKNYLQTQPKAFGRFTIPKRKKNRSEIEITHPKALRMTPDPLNTPGMNLPYPKTVSPAKTNGHIPTHTANSGVSIPPAQSPQYAEFPPLVQFSRIGNPEVITKPLVQYHYDNHPPHKFEQILNINTKEKDNPESQEILVSNTPKLAVGYPETGWILYQIYNTLELPFDDWNSLRDLVQSYLSTYDLAFPLPYREIFEEDFFKFSVISIIPSLSAEMLHVFNTLAIADLKLGTTKRRDK